MSDDKLIDKFMDCASHSARPLPHETLSELVKTVMNLQEVKDMGDIARFL